MAAGKDWQQRARRCFVALIASAIRACSKRDKVTAVLGPITVLYQRMHEFE